MTFFGRQECRLRVMIAGPEKLLVEPIIGAIIIGGSIFCNLDSGGVSCVRF